MLSAIVCEIILTFMFFFIILRERGPRLTMTWQFGDETIDFVVGPVTPCSTPPAARTGSATTVPRTTCCKSWLQPQHR